VRRALIYGELLFLTRKMKNLNKWYILCSVLIAIISVQSIFYFVLNREYLSLTSNYEALENECEALESIHNSLSNNHTTLQIQYTSLLGDFANLQSSYSTLEANYTNLETTFLDLNTTHTSLFETHAILNEQYTQLQGDYDTLLLEYQDYLTLEQQYNTLLLQYNNLQSQYTSLEDEYNRYVTAYQNLRDEINQRRNHPDVESFVTPQDSSVIVPVLDITGGWSNTSDWNEFWDDVKAMYQWVVDNIEYRYDGLYPVLPYDPSGGVSYSTEMWQFANETLDLQKGDCEDQAILLCSLIRSYCSLNWIECIGISSSTSAHLAVQILVSGDKLVIFDPAGNYYSHDFWGDIEFNDITTEINNWLDYWKPSMGSDVYVYRVFSDYMDKTFSSTSEYLVWMYSR